MIRTLLHRLRHEERGEVEDVPVLIAVFLILMIFGGSLFILAQFANANSQVQAAAFAAARDASLSGSTNDDVQAATDAAQQSLEGNINCLDLHVTMNDSGLRTGLGQTGSVSATVTCSIAFSTLIMPGLPSSTTITKTATSPIDPYRERNG